MKQRESEEKRIFWIKTGSNCPLSSVQPDKCLRIQQILH